MRPVDLYKCVTIKSFISNYQIGHNYKEKTYNENVLKTKPFLKEVALNLHHKNYRKKSIRTLPKPQSEVTSLANVIGHFISLTESITLRFKKIN